MAKDINKDYIGVVKERNGEYKFEQIPIAESYEIKDSLQAMCKNPNRTLLDMQEAFVMNIKTDKKAYKCCLPYPYSSSYISAVCYPRIWSYEEYHADKQAQIDEINKGLKTQSSLSQSEKEQKNKEKTAEYEQRLKEEFLRSALRYIEAMDFTTTRARIDAMSSVRMSSHEVIGWETMKYPINNDLTITVLTNFGYGSSSYFYVNVCYKGIDLLPYSQIVKYYYANMQDIIAHTRSYRAERDSWKTALYFVADLSNRTNIGFEQHAYEWLRNEITEMLDKLRIIKRDPQSVLIKIAEHKPENLVSVRSMLDSEREKYKAYPEELALVFKVEKISNALKLLDKLEQASIIYSHAIQAMEEIKELNVSIVPEIQAAIDRLNNEIDFLKERKLAPIECEWQEAKQKKDAMDKVFDAAYEKVSEPINWESFRSFYDSKHPEYAALRKVVEDLSERRSLVKAEINDRINFKSRLHQCYTDIAYSGLLSA